MDEEAKFVEECHKGHYFPYPMVLIYRSHHILLPYQITPPRYDFGCQNIHRIIYPDRNYAITRNVNDRVDLGRRMAAEKVGLRDTDDDDPIFNSLYFDMELVSSPHFLISRSASSSVWIQDLGSRTGTYLNGQKLKPKCKLKVYDADVVSIGISNLDPACDLRSRKYFVFKIVVRPSKYSIEEIDMYSIRGKCAPEIGEAVDVVDKAANDCEIAPNGAVDAVLRNSLIVSHIFSYLNLPELKSCRLVSKAWNEEISRIMPRKAAIRFSIPTIRPPLETWNTNFQQKVQVMKNLRLGNIKVSLWPSRMERRNLIAEDIFWLMDNFRYQIKCLHLGMQVVDATDVAVLSNILNRLSFLEEIELALIISMNCTMINLPTPVETVHRMTISIAEATLGNGSGATLSASFVRKLLSVFPNAEAVGLLGDADFTKIILLTPAIKDAVFLPFLILKSVTVELYLMENLAVSFLQKLITYPEVVLESLTILSLRLTQPVLDALREALERHAPTLKSLHLRECHCFWTEENLEVTFPHFPNLKQLEVDFIKDWEMWNVLNSDMTTPLVIWKFPSGSVSYKDDFPSLEYLHVGLRVTITMIPQSVQLVKTFFEAFVPMEVGAAQNKRMKKVHFHIPKLYGGNEIWEGHFLENLETIFPNANLSRKYCYDCS